MTCSQNSGQSSSTGRTGRAVGFELLDRAEDPLAGLPVVGLALGGRPPLLEVVAVSGDTGFLFGCCPICHRSAGRGFAVATGDCLDVRVENPGWSGFGRGRQLPNRWPWCRS